MTDKGVLVSESTRPDHSGRRLLVASARSLLDVHCNHCTGGDEAALTQISSPEPRTAQRAYKYVWSKQRRVKRVSRECEHQTELR